MRIVIADDHTLFRDSLRSLLTSRGFEVVGEAREGGEAVDLARRLQVTRTRSAGTPSSVTTSRFVASETAITRAAARTTRGTATRLYVRVQRLNHSGWRSTARSWTVTTSGTRDAGGPRNVGQWSTSTPPRARERRIPERVARDACAARDVPANESGSTSSVPRVPQQPAHVPGRARPRLHERRDVHATAHADSPVPCLQEHLADRAPREPARVLDPAPRSSSRRASASRIAGGDRLRRRRGRRARAASPLASSMDGCDDATTGAPHAIASMIGIPKPSNRDG